MYVKQDIFNVIEELNEMLSWNATQGSFRSWSSIELLKREGLY